MKVLRKKVIVGMSGGVDSSMSAYLLKKQGWQPIGVSLNMPVWHEKKNFSSAQKVCQKLKIPHHIIDVRELFKEKVLKYFLNEFSNIRTPNPCVICNRNLKFASLFTFAQQKGINYVSSGHYARIKKTTSYQLMTARDKTKDQTYNLCLLKKEWLKNIIFPLGDYTKKEVYKLAKKLGFNFLVTQPQSQDFCYLGNQHLDSYLLQTLGKKPGPIINSAGKVLGTHDGLYLYTIGQRKGLKINGGPWFVKDFDLTKNALVVTRIESNINKKEALLSPFNFVSIKPPTKPLKVMAKIRYRQPLSPATIYPLKDYKMKVVFDTPQRACTPGQFTVFYKEDICLGGGRIT